MKAIDQSTHIKIYHLRLTLRRHTHPPVAHHLKHIQTHLLHRQGYDARIVTPPTRVSATDITGQMIMMNERID